MPTKKPTKRPSAKSTKPTSKGLIKSRFKFSKLGVTALAAVLGIAGVVYVFSSYAESGCPSSEGVHQCVENSPGIHHSGGEVSTGYFYAASGFFTRTVWVATYEQTLGHYMWYGPYLSAVIASPVMGRVHGVKACWYYADTSPVRTTFNVSENSGARVLYSSTKTVRASYYQYHNGLTYEELQSFCTDVNMTPGSHTGIEVRVKPADTQYFGDSIIMYKTTWQQY